MINRNVELREMDLGDVGSTNWSNQTISKGMASKGQVYLGLTFTLNCKFPQIIRTRPT